MLEQIFSVLTTFIANVISTFGYPGIALLMGIQTVAIPIPSEIILPFAGYLVFTGRFEIWLVALVGAVGSCLGSLVAYFIGKAGGRPLVQKYGKWVLISKHDLNLADNFFRKHGNEAVFFGMMLPIFRSFISFPAGVAKVPVKKFVTYVFLGSFIWGVFLSFIGMKLGENWSTLRTKFQGFEVALFVLAVFAGVYWVYRHIKMSKSDINEQK